MGHSAPGYILALLYTHLVLSFDRPSTRRSSYCVGTGLQWGVG
jgi:hypothetical protein